MAYVYLHTKPSGEIFYVGKGNGYRAWAKNKRSDYWKRTVDKYGYNVKIFIDNVSNEKALSIEKDLIEAIGLENLVNFTKGGDGCLGYSHTEESKKKISIGRKGKKHSEKTKKILSKKRIGKSAYNKGLKTSKEVREKISKKLKNRVISEETRKKMSESHKGKKFSDEHKKNLRKANKNRTFTREAILKSLEVCSKKLIDTKTNIEYRSIRDFCTKNKISESTFYSHFRGRTKNNKFKHIKEI